MERRRACPERSRRARHNFIKRAPLMLGFFGRHALWGGLFFGRSAALRDGLRRKEHRFWAVLMARPRSGPDTCVACASVKKIRYRIPPLLRSRKPVNATVIFVPKSERNSSPIIPTMLNIPNPSITPKGLWSTCYFARFRQCIGVGVLFEKLSRIKGLAVPDGTMKLEPDLVLALTATRKSLVSQESHPVHKAMGPVINAIDSAFRHILAWLECSHFAPPE